MKCAFCGSETEEKHNKGKIIVIAHFWCLADRMDELGTEDWRECLVYEDRIKEYGAKRYKP